MEKSITKVYVVEHSQEIRYDEVPDQVFKNTAEENGGVYTLEDFQEEFNQDIFGTFDSRRIYIRFIESNIPELKEE